MSITGNLKTMELAELLQWLSGARKTGTLVVDNGKVQKQIYFRDGRVTRLDGLSIDYDDWHFNVRPSNTEPLLRLNLEAGSRGDMERRRDEVLSLVRG